MQGPEFDQLLKDNGCATVDDLYIRVGYGKVAPADIIAAVAPQKVSEDTQPSFLQKVIRSAVNRNKKTSKNLITVDGMDDVLVRYAKCCVPIPGDPIIGFITRGRGITVHTKACQRIQEFEESRKVDVEWNQAYAFRHPVSIRVITHDRPGILSRISNNINSLGVNIIFKANHLI